MNQQEKKTYTRPLIQVIRNFFQKLRQNPEIYPIKYYKKGHRYRRAYRQSFMK